MPEALQAEIERVDASGVQGLILFDAHDCGHGHMLQSLLASLHATHSSRLLQPSLHCVSRRAEDTSGLTSGKFVLPLYSTLNASLHASNTLMVTMLS